MTGWADGGGYKSVLMPCVGGLEAKMSWWSIAGLLKGRVCGGLGGRGVRGRWDFREMLWGWGAGGLNGEEMWGVLRGAGMH